MNLTSIESLWVELSGLSHRWYVMAKDNFGRRRAISAPYDSLDAALAAARAIESGLC
ncbi:hypothetical protein [Methylogaea oryzae]|uniref:Uncharacterized protein n=1 Tax=Methylogaea oryzae TaxID=1295382 RepID=A0A8D4VR98_9GAMM|nr:hypothetical protein [Methylogaea oryzae]BBL71157.1 hypothetical protein MoryE10_17630 [Methylogaea oryzae]